MFYREIIENLNNWAERKNRKPLILRGARQVGKTTAVEMFSKQFDQYICINLEKTEERVLFEKQYPFDRTYRNRKNIASSISGKNTFGSICYR